MISEPVAETGKSLRHYFTYSLLALPVGCFVGGLVIGLFDYLLPGGMSGFWSSIGLGLFVGLLAIPISIIPTFLYGAPAYALVAIRHRPNVFISLVIGALPGLVLMVFSPDWSILFLVFGLPIAVSLHFFSNRRVAHDN